MPGPAISLSYTVPSLMPGPAISLSYTVPGTLPGPATSLSYTVPGTPARALLLASVTLCLLLARPSRRVPLFTTGFGAVLSSA